MIVEFSRLARRELNDIGVWIAKDDPDTATRFVDRIEVACHEIGERPRLYPLLPGSRSIRKRLVGRYHPLSRTKIDRDDCLDPSWRAPTANVLTPRNDSPSPGIESPT